jgi:regulator of sirC expression with transglutaminase-like and TPR domain
MDSALSPQPDPGLGSIRAAAELLLDPSPRVHEACAARLRAWGSRVLPVLSTLLDCEDPGARIRVRRLYRRIELDHWGHERESLLRQQPFDLERLWIEVGTLARPNLSSDALRKRLDLYAALLEPRLRRNGTRHRAEQFCDFFHGELGFRGNRDCYDHPDNCFLASVLERRRGMPAALCALYLLVARRLQIQVEPIALPGHFLLRFPGPRPIFVDPFNDGRVLTRKACLRKLRELGYGYHAETLRACGDEEVLARILSNLVHTLGLLGRSEEAETLRLFREGLATPQPH